MVSPFEKALLRDNATFHGYSIQLSRDAIYWLSPPSVEISSHGQVIVKLDDGSSTVFLENLQSCHVSIQPPIAQATSVTKRRFSRRIEQKKLPEDPLADEPPVIYVRSYENDKCYFKIPSKNVFGNLLSALMAWQNMRPAGLAKKWFAENKIDQAALASKDPHEVLVCRFRVYGPIPPKVRHLNLVDMPRAPNYALPFDSPEVHSDSTSLLFHDQPVQEGWFYTMGVLKSNGTLHFITELDGTLLYSIDVKQIFSSEIRELHHSICDSSNILFLGQIKELRWNNIIRTSSALSLESLSQTTPSLLFKDGRPIPNNSRILIDFPLHIDLEDWFVGLNYFCKREYIGIYDEHSRLKLPSKKLIHLESTIDPDSTLEDHSTSKSQLETSQNKLDLPPSHDIPNPSLKDYAREHLRVSKKLKLDIIEARFDNVPHTAADSGKIYAEVIMWGFPWARTAFVPHTYNPFWKEEFTTDLPISTQMVHILIRKCSSSKSVYLQTDKVVGTVFLTPDILSQKLHNVSTMMNLNAHGNGISVPGLLSSTDMAAAANTAAQTNSSVRLSIYDAANLPIGKLLLSVDLKEYLIPSPAVFKPLERMLHNCPMKDIIDFCNSTVSTSEFENVSFILLDIFQSLGIEDKWFKALVEVELIDVDRMTRKNYIAKSTSANPSSNNVFNTLFRGSSIFTKSLEKYIFRIGQEYLEKVFGDLFERITKELVNCEIDPRYVRLHERARRRRENLGLVNPSSGTEDEDNDESDDEEVDAETEKAREEEVQKIIQNNYKNLIGYAEQLWQKIYTTSNDLPDQIKLQLKNLRNKLDLACDPDDKKTALNCLSAFIFLRFFCPAILNPKLFYLTKNHQSGNSQRTLTLIAKVLLNMGNRQEFSQHKEPHLVPMNAFLEAHLKEVLDYFDKITDRKNDFNEKVLELSHEVNRFDLGLSGDTSSSELPTTPYLIDKCLRLTELIHLLQINVGGRQRSHMPSGSSSSITTSLTTLTIVKSNQNTPVGRYLEGADRDFNDELEINEDGNVYQIGSLEFEKSDFLDLVGDNETEGFIKSLCRSNEEIFSFITNNITFKDLQNQSVNITSRVEQLSHKLDEAEECGRLQHDNKLWAAFVEQVVNNGCVDTQRNAIVYYDSTFQEKMVAGHKRLKDQGFASLKLKFPVESDRQLMTPSFSSNSLGSVMRGPSKNPLKRWLKKV